MRSSSFSLFVFAALQRPALYSTRGIYGTHLIIILTSDARGTTWIKYQSKKTLGSESIIDLRTERKTK